MLKRLLPAAAACAVATFGITATAQAQQVNTAPSLHAKVVNLHAAYLAALPHARVGKITGIVYARHKQPQAGGRQPANGRHAACTEPNCALPYHGGPVQVTPHVYLLLWGPNWSSDPAQEASAAYLESFYKGLGVAPEDVWSTLTSQYGDGSGSPTFGSSVFMGTSIDASTPPKGATQAQIQTEAQVLANKLNITDLTDAQIVVATQSGTCPQNFAASCNGTSGTYCGWHAYAPTAPQVPYTNLPYMPDAGGNCGQFAVQNQWDGFSIVGGHEYTESITDPAAGNGWIDTADTGGGEIGDKCAWIDPVTHNANLSKVTLSTGTFAMQPLFSNKALSNYNDGCVMSPTQDTVSVTNPGIQSVSIDGNLSLQVSGTSSAGLALNWSANGLPTGLTMNTSGLITGHPTKATTYTSAVTATDSTGASDTASVFWTVNPLTGKPIIGDHGLCLDDSGASTVNGNKIDIYRCNGTGSQDFTFKNRALIVFGKCLSDATWGGTGAPVLLWDCNNKAVEQWTHTTTGEYVNAHNNLCITDPSASTVLGTAVLLRTCRAEKDQKWSLP
ncbi:MAG TPA: ricin-type beta-trefoil lectin domain protein [Streptosporangiaceae bacterium]|nr:ricin-type beta-trefoil lectin domain protein [Streptosporangiaceae bacterium]